MTESHMEADLDQNSPKSRVNKNHLQGFIVGVLLTIILCAVGLFIYFSNDRNEHPEENLMGSFLDLGILYRAFPLSIYNEIDFSRNEDFYIGELCLMPERTALRNSIRLEGDITLPFNDHTFLFSVLYRTSKETVKNFSLPNFDADIPVEGLRYFITNVGEYPSGTGEILDYIADGEIKYFETSLYETRVYFYTGQILLAKDVDESQFERWLLPCDGRMLSMRDEPFLGLVLGNKYGGDGTSNYKLPDLSDVSPIEGAKYYIVRYGMYPTND
ncbi:MAG: phage tail protein [Eubacteriales bacterium]|nr:phage tail protein [Eubacteriales bacterium]MDD4324029.1 phage tail protein [Eubacteriales bacterium]MDD4541574.1 phage tail protein [Eubacteriales bacterium]